MLRSPKLQLFVLIVAFATATNAQPPHPYKYFRLGSPQDAATKTQPGFALMGGGTDLDEAFRWMCNRTGGGDFLVLKATGGDDYNPYIQPLCKLNSVATLILPSREAANDPFAAATIAHAEAVFIAGGDQANYIRSWMGTPVQTAINAAIKRGVPIGGTSSGLAVLGEWAYSAEGDKPDDPNLDAQTALMNPLGPRITLVQGFLDIHVLKGIVTDTHFARRNRMGRLLVFLSHIQNSNPNKPIRAIGVEQQAAILLEPDGSATVVGKGSAYLVEATTLAIPLNAGKPLSGASFQIRRVNPGQSLNLLNWTATLSQYKLTVDQGKIHSTQLGDALY